MSITEGKSQIYYQHLAPHVQRIQRNKPPRARTETSVKENLARASLFTNQPFTHTTRKKLADKIRMAFSFVEAPCRSIFIPWHSLILVVFTRYKKYNKNTWEKVSSYCTKRSTTAITRQEERYNIILNLFRIASLSLSLFLKILREYTVCN